MYKPTSQKEHKIIYLETVLEKLIDTGYYLNNKLRYLKRTQKDTKEVSRKLEEVTTKTKSLFKELDEYWRSS